MSKTVRVRVNKPIPPHVPGDEVKVEVDSQGTPTDFQWRRRFKDAKIDDCCEVVAERKAKAKTRRRATVEEEAPASEE